jgi:hypothetical protein
MVKSYFFKFIIGNLVIMRFSVHSCQKKFLNKHLHFSIHVLVRTHANLKLEQYLDVYESGILPWDIEMMVEESFTEFLTPSLNRKLNLD